MIKKLNDRNFVPVYSIHDECFSTYGRIVDGYDFDELTLYMEAHTLIPESGNIYVPSDEKMENTEAYKRIKSKIYGGMDIQIGYCNGKNSTYNGFEYHKGSELNIAVTDFMLVLGHIWDIQGNQYSVEKAKVFYVEKGSAIEMYQTTLHLSPCKVKNSGFMDIVVLPRGTNMPLDSKIEPFSAEDRLLLMKNKWIIAHPEREPLIKQGAHAGLIGENIELRY